MSIESEFFAATLYLVPDEKRFFMKNQITGETEPLAIPYHEFFVLHQLIKGVGLETAIKTASYLVFVANDLGLSAEQNERLRHVLEAIYNYKGPGKEEEVLGLTYDLVYDRVINRDQAAELASALLGRAFKSDTWRKRVDKFARDRDLPKIKVYARHTDTSENRDGSSN